MRLPGARVLASTVVVVLLGACTSGPHETSDADDGAPFAFGPFQTYVMAELGETELGLVRLEQARREATIAACMVRSGFEYTPEPWNESAMIVQTAEEFEEDLRARGWGYFTAGEVVSHEDMPPKSAQQEYVESLSPSAQAEYTLALVGEYDLGVGAQIPGQVGCIHEAENREQPESPSVSFAELWTEIEGAWEVAEESPDLIDARERYRECMALAGFSGIRLAPSELLQARWGEVFPTASYSSSDPRLPELAEWEVVMANAHLDCREETGVAEVAARATAKVEREIMERRAEEVEAYVAALREQAAG